MRTPTKLILPGLLLVGGCSLLNRFDDVAPAQVEADGGAGAAGDGGAGGEAGDAAAGGGTSEGGAGSAGAGGEAGSGDGGDASDAADASDAGDAGDAGAPLYSHCSFEASPAVVGTNTGEAGPWSSDQLQLVSTTDEHAFRIVAQAANGQTVRVEVFEHMNGSFVRRPPIEGERVVEGLRSGDDMTLVTIGLGPSVDVRRFSGVGAGDAGVPAAVPVVDLTSLAVSFQIGASAAQIAPDALAVAVSYRKDATTWELGYAVANDAADAGPATPTAIYTKSSSDDSARDQTGPSRIASDGKKSYLGIGDPGPAIVIAENGPYSDADLDRWQTGADPAASVHLLAVDLAPTPATPITFNVAAAALNENTGDATLKVGQVAAKDFPQLKFDDLHVASQFNFTTDDVPIASGNLHFGSDNRLVTLAPSHDRSKLFVYAVAVDGSTAVSTLLSPPAGAGEVEAATATLSKKGPGSLRIHAAWIQQGAPGQADASVDGGATQTLYYAPVVCN